MLALPPLSLYIHFPWCIKKCFYCDFNSHTIKTTLPEEEYVESLISDFVSELSQIQGRVIRSIYFGGGTPSLLSGGSVKCLLEKIRQHVELDSKIEITLEANPGSIDSEKFQAFYAAGINRLSIGVQSFKDKYLVQLGRIHDEEMALKAIEAAKQAGFTNFNIDLMHGLPNQSYEEGLEDLKKALDLAPPHLSWYQLTLEPHTPFFKNPPSLPSEDIITDLQEEGESQLMKAGFIRYEISAFSRPGFECFHNKHYWSFGDYLGIGAGAHSKITCLEKNSIFRFWKKPHPKAYMMSQGEFRGGFQSINTQQLPFEFMLNSLRQYTPISRELFESRTGLAFEHLMPSLEKASAQGLLEWENNLITMTALGKRFYNNLVALFL